MALYAQLCRTMGFTPFGTLKVLDHEQVLKMKSGETAAPHIIIITTLVFGLR